jgi:hypothetical protein
LREVCNGNTLNVYMAPDRDRFTDVPLYDQAAIDAAVAAERERCAAWVDARRDAFCEEHGSIDPSTGALEFGRGPHAEAKSEYVGELEEIAAGLRALAPNAQLGGW